MKNNVYDNLNTRNTTQDDVILNVVKSVTASVLVRAGTKVRAGELLVSTDGGLTFSAAVLPEYDPLKADYTNDTVVINAGHIFTAIGVTDAGEIGDNAKWRDEGEYIINGALMVTHEREVPSGGDDETFKSAVMVDGELLGQNVPNMNEASRVAAFPSILIK